MAKPKRKKPYLWATTYASSGTVRIYARPGYNTDSGETDGVDIWISGHILDIPELLDSTLMHEFIHVLEHQFSKELKMKPPAHCTQAAVVFGRELPTLLKNLRRLPKA